MKITSLSFKNWRNLEDAEIHPGENVNVFYGDNAQGKTNLLEAVWCCTGMRSFRGSKEAEFIKIGEAEAKLELKFFSNAHDQTIKYKTGEKGKEIFLNDVKLKSPAQLAEAFDCVVFSPDNLSMIKGGPANRRKFADTALCQLKPAYSKLISNYRRLLDQRNAVLKDYQSHAEVEYVLDMFEEQLASLGSRISKQRLKYIEKISPFVTKFYSELTGGAEKIGLIYNGEKYSSDNGGEKLLAEELKAARLNDAVLKATTVGPHRHDITVTINNLPVREYGSQGQQRSCALALKLSEAAVLGEFIGEQPVVLLDDVMSELDTGRQDYILNRLKDRQVFITCCEPEQVIKMTGGRAFYIEKGKITPQNKELSE